MAKVDKVEEKEILKVEETVVVKNQDDLKQEDDKAEYVCPLTVNYKELEEMIGDQDLADYIGDNLPKEEVERIVTDFNIYKQNKK